jgi:hypothetical protein
MRYRTTLALTCAFFAASCGPNQGGPNGHLQRAADAPVAGPASAPAPALAPRPGPLALKAEHIDVQKDGDGLPPAQVLDGLLRLNLDKGKFESDAEYTNRLKTLSTAKIYDDVTVTDLVGFRPLDVSFSYDANKELWNFKVIPRQVDFTFNHMRVYRETLTTGDFTAYEHVYPGRHLEFAKTIYLTINGLKGLSDIIGSVKVPRAEAPAYDDSLSLLFVGRLNPAQVRSARKLPDDFNDNEVEFQNALGFKLEGVWLIDRRTGRVLSKTWKVHRLA